jgi:hypothetical protein
MIDRASAIAPYRHRSSKQSAGGQIGVSIPLLIFTPEGRIWGCLSLLLFYENSMKWTGPILAFGD